MNTCRGHFPIEMRGAGEGASRRVRIMTSALARDGDVVDPLGMSVDNYLRNPVVLWAHDAAGRTASAGLPIGRTLSLERQSDAIDVAFEFLPGDAFAERVANAWDRGFLRTASIGWTSLAVEPLANGRGLRHTKSELLEWSLVPVPADPNASREVWAEGLRALGFADLLNLTPVPFPKGKGEILPLARLRERTPGESQGGEGPGSFPRGRGKAGDGGSGTPHALAHPPVAQLVAELEEAWDYLRARLGPDGVRSPRVRQALFRLAGEVGTLLGGWPTKDAIAPNIASESRALLEAAERLREVTHGFESILANEVGSHVPSGRVATGTAPAVETLPRRLR